ncbi:MAG: hypothetical protein ABI904_06870 [Chloroflexota bacterium]
MFSKALRSFLFFGVAVVLLSIYPFRISARAQASTDKTIQKVHNPAVQTGPIFTQPVDPNGKLLLSSRLDPDGSDNDQYIWDNFTLPSNGTITEIDWFGVYDPARSGAGGPVLDFSISIYPSAAANTEPGVANPPLAHYQTGGNAGETSIGTVGGNALYVYSFSLPTSFAASAGVKYWVQIEASQKGSIPDWCFAAGSGGNGNLYLRNSGAGGDVIYRSAPGDAAFNLLGSLSDPTPPAPAVTATSSTDIPTATPAPQVPPCSSAAILIVMELFLFRLSHR